MANKDLVREWQRDEVTLELYKMIRQARDYALAQLLHSDAEKTHATAETIGFIRGLDLILDAELEDSEETTN